MDTTFRECAWVLDRIDAYLDGAEAGLGATESRRVETHVAGCAGCARELAFARQCRDELRELPRFDPPQRVIDEAARESAREAARESLAAAIPLRRHVQLPRWTVAVAAALSIAAAGLWWSRAHETSVEDTAAVEEASFEAAVAFAYVGKYTDRTRHLIRDDVIGLRIVLPMHRAFSASREAVIDDALVPGMRRAIDESGLGATSEPHQRS